ncbi:alpha beta-hydrolase [Coniophora puteana RWD-64-598 SS2]|uniref:Alpha beta-hydrolase n=1 Tax=Coniophora puteana (strain RWD-64-598) TaxID=741705 RepID=A0A5M3MPK2_CONPW|nr:alpha beta-hydrolase [Coniophora puteana RWD-64-598 SS2]EIW80990.1 alpha beta-hydrolase [Coniophora puteana RWD-64-598 SS2]
MLFTAAAVVALAAALRVSAVPAPVEAWVSSLTNMSASDLSALAPYTQMARAAYCDPSKVTGWQCGDACNAVPGVQITTTGGDGDSVQYYYVGYYPTDNSVVVAHQGTDPTQFLSDLTDADIPMENLNSTLFPGVDSSVQVHKGFADEHAQTADIILSAVKSLISSTGATMVTLIGHSLGGALAELECMYMHLNLPSNIAVRGRTYGTPRVGNAAWASFFDSSISDFMRVDNEKDPIPICPGRFLNYSHVQGEVHIVQTDYAVECPGDDDATDAQCTISTVPNVADGDILNHLGPYQGIYIGTIYCT